MSKREICKRREVVVLKDGKVQETFPSLQAFAFRYGKALNMATVLQRLNQLFINTTALLLIAKITIFL